MAKIDRPEDPAVLFKFGLEIDGIMEGFFMECSGLRSEREVVEYKEGGENSFVHKFVGPVKFSNVVLKRGITASNELLKWHQLGQESGTTSRKNVSILMFDQKGATLKRWNLEEAYPIKWAGPDLKAESSNVAIETIELIHHGLFLAT